MSRISELISCVKIYNLCNHCDHYKCGECSADEVNCKEEIEKQIVSEIRSDAIDEVKAEYKRMFNCGYTDCVTCDVHCNARKFMDKLEQLKEQNNEKN